MSEAALNDLPADLPAWMARHRVTISRLCVGVIVVAALVQVAELFVDLGEWFSMGVLNVSSAALGVDAMVRGVRKRAGEGPSIRNLAPGGWTIFASMFWIVAIPAYFLGPQRRRPHEVVPAERVMIGSWVAVAAFTALGLWIMLVVAPNV